MPFTRCNTLEVLHLCARGHVLRRGRLAQLQSADVSRNRPAIRWSQLRRVIGHGAVTVGHYIKVVRDGLREAHLVVQVSGRLVAALHNFAFTVAYARVAGSAVNIEPLLAALKHFHRDRERHHVLLFAVAICAQYYAGVEVAVGVQLAAGDGVEDLRTRSAMVGEYVRSALRDHLRLVLHVLAAADDQQESAEASDDQYSI